MENTNQKIDFEVSEDISIVDIVYDILKKNRVEESGEEWLRRHAGNNESLVLIVRNAALVIMQKKIPEQKLAEIMAKHMNITEETAEKIIEDIKLKLTPFIKINNFTKAQEELIKKLKASEDAFKEEIPEEKSPLPYIKKTPIIDVEDNAKVMEKERKNITTEEKFKFTKKPEERKSPKTQESKPDPYKEPVK